MAKTRCEGVTTHTPGPWINDNGLVYSRGRRISYDIFDAAEWAGYEAEGHANASLIAAAPEMLELIRDLATDCDGRVLPGLKRRAVEIVAKVADRQEVEHS